MRKFTRVMTEGKIVFVQIAKCISGSQYEQVQDSGDGEGENCIRPNCKMYFVQIAKCISGSQYAQVQDSGDREGKKGDGGGGGGEE